MGTSVTKSIESLGPYLRTLGMVSLFLVGLGMLLEAVSGYIDLGYGASHGFVLTTGDGIWAALDTLLLIISLLTIIASVSVQRGVFPQTMVMGMVLLAILSLLVQGGGMLAISISPPSWVSAAALAIAAALVLLIGLFNLRGPTVGMKFTGGIFTLAFTILLITRLSAIGGAPGGGYSLSSYLLYPFTAYYFDPGYGFTALGIVGFTFLVLAAYLIVSVGVIFYTVLQKSRLVPIAWVITIVGFLLYGIEMAWGNIAALGNADWSYVSSEATVTVTPVITAIVLAVAAFVVIATAITGMVFYGGNLAEIAIAQLSIPQTTPVEATAGIFCSKCGAKNPAENAFCGKCGKKLG